MGYVCSGCVQKCICIISGCLFELFMQWLCADIHSHFRRVVIWVIYVVTLCRNTSAFSQGGYLGYLCSGCVQKYICIFSGWLLGLSMQWPCAEIHLYSLRVVIWVIYVVVVCRNAFVFPQGGYMGHQCSSYVQKYICISSFWLFGLLMQQMCEEMDMYFLRVFI